MSLFFQGVAIADDDRLIKRDINVYRSQVKITAYNSRGYKVRIKNQISFLLIYNCKSREKKQLKCDSVLHPQDIPSVLEIFRRARLSFL